jgi:hypothetical protein
MGIDHLRLDLDLTSEDWHGDAAAGLCQARSLGAGLEVALFSDRSKPSRLETCIAWMAENSSELSRVLVFDRCEKATPAWLIEDFECHRGRAGLKIPIAYGTNAYFAELNRNRPEFPCDSLVCYSINPQVHAFDELSLCETCEGQHETLESAGAVFGRPVVVSPITLRPRFNPNATSDSAQHETAFPETDPRQASQFAAAWTVASLAQLATNQHVASLTWYETIGPRGVMDLEGQRYPVGDAIAAVLQSSECAGAKVSRPLEAAALGLIDRQGRSEILLANLSDQEQRIEVEMPTGEVCSLVLAAYAVESIGFEEWRWTTCVSP